jgi:hypothetical protein
MADRWPIHPAVTGALARNAVFTDALGAAVSKLGQTRPTVSSPDGDITLTFDGTARLIDAQFNEDVLVRYRPEELSELLTALCGVGWELAEETTATIVGEADMHVDGV